VNDAGPEVSTWQQALNRAALGLALAILTAIGVLWWRDRTHVWETPRWDARRFERLAPPLVAEHATWMVVVNPDCPHCRARLAELQRRPHDSRRDPALGALLVDVARRPRPPESGAPLEGGVYWDSLGIWRGRWGHRVYGEVLVFAADGSLERTVAPELDPGAPRAR
jgi:hypothetical protein